MISVVGLSGKIATGKTTVAEHLVVHHGFERRAYGDMIKEEVAELLNLPLASYHTRVGKKQLLVGLLGVGLDQGYAFPRAAMTLREVLQWYGTDYRRGQDPLYWEAQMQAWLDSGQAGPRIVIDDVRFPTEAAQVHDNGGMLVRIQPYHGWVPGAHASHSTETALDGYPRFHLVRRPGAGESERLADEIADAAGARVLVRKSPGVGV